MLKNTRFLHKNINIFEALAEEINIEKSTYWQ